MNKLNIINVYAFLAGLAAMQILMMFTRYMTASNEVPNPFSREYQEAVAEQSQTHLHWVENGPMKIGMIMPDGTIYAGISPDTKKPYYTTKEDVDEFMPFFKARELCMRLSQYDNGSWRLPTTNELDDLYAHRQDIGGFNTNGEGVGSWHWSSGQRFFTAGMKRFTDGAWYNVGKTVSVNIRCVRDQMPQQVDAQAQQAAEEAAQIEPAAGGEESAAMPPLQQSGPAPAEPQTAPQAYQRAVLTGRHPQ